MANKKTQMSFEEAMEKLQEAANQLRSGKLSLQESVEVYDKSIEYYKFCSEFLENARQKIEIFNPATGSLEDLSEE